MRKEIQAELRKALIKLKDTTQGFSISPYNNKLPDQGYMVGGSGFELRCSPSNFNIDMVLNYMLHIPYYEYEQFIGGWTSDSGDICIDISVWKSDLSEAIGLAKSRSQEAIYDLGSQEDIKTI